MAFFKLTDITFNKDTKGPLSKIDPNKSDGIGLDTNLLKYPIDLGNTDKGHYMIFYINEQVSTQFSNASNSPNDPTIQRFREAVKPQRGSINAGESTSTLLGSVANLAEKAKEVVGSETVEGLKGFAATIGNAISSKNDPLGQTPLAQQQRSFVQYASGFGSALNQLSDQINSGSFLRKIRRTKQAIALYMPDTLTFAYSQSYNDLAVFDTLGLVGTALAAGSSIIDAVQNGASQRSAINVASFGLDFLRQVSGSGTIGNIANIGLAQLGVASNPGLEVIYGSPSFRSFRFDFLFYPRSRQEAETVQNIINSLKFHQAPEYASQTGGKFLIPPSEFDIEFYYNGKINPNIPKISTCVLTSIDLDYAPNGFTAYEVPAQTASLGGTGMPVAIRMSLNFKETQIVTKEYLRWAESGDPFRTREEIEYSKSLGNFPG